MSLLNYIRSGFSKTKTFVKSRKTWTDLALGAALTIGAWHGIPYLTRSNPESEQSLIYQGSLEGRNITYQEDVTTKLDGSPKGNVMTVRSGKDVYTLIDTEDSTSIDWKATITPSYVRDSLEAVIVEKGGNRYFFNSDGTSNSPMGEEKTIEIVKKCSDYFNANRTKVREKKRELYAAEVKKIEDFFTPIAPPVPYSTTPATPIVTPATPSPATPSTTTPATPSSTPPATSATIPPTTPPSPTPATTPNSTN